MMTKNLIHFAFRFENASANLLCNNSWTLLTKQWTVVDSDVTCKDCIKKLIEDKVMQEQKPEQDLTKYIKHIFTLKSGTQIEILTKKSYREVVKIDLQDGFMTIKGFILMPLIVEKIIEIDYTEIAAREEITEPCIAHVIPWPQVEGEDSATNKHSKYCVCAEFY